MSGVINVRCGECLVWSMSGVINVLFHTRCDQCLVWSMSSLINVWCDQCLVWSMSGVINVRCDQCPILHTVWSMSGVINVWCDQCPFLHTVWSMSGVINVCVINVVQSSLGMEIGVEQCSLCWLDVQLSCNFQSTTIYLAAEDNSAVFLLWIIPCAGNIPAEKGKSILCFCISILKTIKTSPSTLGNPILF